MHYQRWRRKGTPERGQLADFDRFMQYVDQNGPVPPTRPDLGPCWIWTRSTIKGYGKFSTPTVRNIGAHRWLYQHLNGPVGALDLDHLCRVRRCVNPTHLEPVTRQVNLARGVRADSMSTRTHCSNGHPYDEANTGRTPDGKERWCRTCKREKTRARRQAGTLVKR